MEEREKVFKKLDELYSNEKSQKFVLHLIRAYLPLDKCQKVFDKPENIKKFKCALTNTELISVSCIFNIMQSKEYKDGFMDDLLINSKNEIPEDYQPLLLKLAKGKILGYTGKDTSTYLTHDSVDSLFNWVSHKILSGDKKINWTMRQMQKDSFLSQFDSFKDEETRKQVKRIDKVVKNPKKANVTLGDLDVLQKLKDKLEKDEL